MLKLWSHAQFEQKLIVLVFTLLTACDISSVSQPLTTVTQMNHYSLLLINIALGVTEVNILIQLVRLQNV